MHGKMSKGTTRLKSKEMQIHGSTGKITGTYSLQGGIENRSRQSQSDNGNAAVYKRNGGKVIPGTHAIIEDL